MADEEKTLPPIRIGTSDLRVIGHVLMSYEKEIRHTVSPSPNRDALLKTTQTLRERIVAAKKATEKGAEHYFPLTAAELAVIDSAFTAFVVSIGHVVPQSAERDEIMRECEALKAYIIAGCTPPDAS